MPLVQSVLHGTVLWGTEIHKLLSVIKYEWILFVQRYLWTFTGHICWTIHCVDNYLNMMSWTLMVCKWSFSMGPNACPLHSQMQNHFKSALHCQILIMRYWFETCNSSCTSIKSHAVPCICKVFITMLTEIGITMSNISNF